MADQEQERRRGGGRRERARDDRTPRQMLAAERATVVKVVFGLAVIIIFIIFIVQNSDEVEIDFVFTSAKVGLIWVFLVCAIVGGLVTWLIGRPRRRALKRYADAYDRDHRGRGRPGEPGPQPR
jgi:uncharacterized integral membrane protein